MMTIYKYPIKVEDEQVVEIPKWAEILCVQVQNGTPCLWAKVNTEQDLVNRTIITVGTGHQFPEFTKNVYIGTYQLPGLVFHVFEDRTQRQMF